MWTIDEVDFKRELNQTSLTPLITVPTPAGTAGSFSVKGLVYEHTADARTTVGHLAAEAGMTKAQVRQWLAAQDVRMHHFEGDTMQLVPTPLHTGVHHTGSRALSGQ